MRTCVHVYVLFNVAMWTLVRNFLIFLAPAANERMMMVTTVMMTYDDGDNDNENIWEVMVTA